MNTDSLADWLSHLEKCHGESTIELGLERIQAVFTRLAITSLAKQVVLVAGTNGKGSTVAALESLLLASNTSVATYTSPHLLVFNERLRLNGENVDDASLCDAFQRIRHAQKMDEEDAVALTYFEFITLACFLIVSQRNVDVALLEIGLGGRFDAVNIASPDVCVITSIALDHQAWLGDSLQSIAFEKAGILRPEVPFVCGQTDQQAYLVSLADALDAPSYLLGRDFTITDNQHVLQWQGRNNCKEAVIYPLTKLQLPTNSVACALQVVNLLDFTMSSDKVEKVLSDAKLPGRYQKIYLSNGVQLVLDVAHNEAAATLLAENLSKDPCLGKQFAVFSLLGDKDLNAVLTATSLNVDAWFITKMKHERAATSEALLSTFDELNLAYKYSENSQHALSLALKNAQAGDRIVVFGSFYLLSELMPDIFLLP